MWGKRAHNRDQLPEFDRRGPVLVEMAGEEDDLELLANDYSAFGGTLRALLVPRHTGGRDEVEVQLDYASWKLVVGKLPEELSQEFYRPLRRMERQGALAVCVASIEPSAKTRARRDSAFTVWLNPAA